MNAFRMSLAIPMSLCTDVGCEERGYMSRGTFFIHLLDYKPGPRVTVGED